MSILEAKTTSGVETSGSYFLTNGMRKEDPSDSGIKMAATKKKEDPSNSGKTTPHSSRENGTAKPNASLHQFLCFSENY